MMALVFGAGTWTLWYGALLLTFLMLMGTAVYACIEPSGPSAGPMLMLLVFILAFAGMFVMTSVDVALLVRALGYGFMSSIFAVLLAWIILGLSWTFLFWATDPNDPPMLIPGRALFIGHSLLLYAGNLWVLSFLRSR